MKHQATFDYFLSEVVNLNKTRVDVAEKSVDTMTSFLKKNDLFGPKFKNTSPQGSFRQRTIIKPASPEIDFDVDILFEMDRVENWSPKDYLEKLAGEYTASGIYKDKVDTRGKTRCVTIDYESDFHVDIVPCIEKDGGLVIMNKKDDSYEQTDGDGYARWFEDQNALTSGDFLIKVVRLIKYLRDIKQEFEVKSVVLTTLLGNEVDESDASETSFADLPTALKTLLDRLDTFLQNNPEMPEVCNPVLADENFNRNWDQEKYKIFREKIRWNNEKVNKAFDETDEAKSLLVWQEIFGEEFELPDAGEREAAKSILDFDLDDHDHREPVTKIATREFLTKEVRIEASVYKSKYKIKLFNLTSDGKVKAGFHIKYEAHTNVRPPFEVKWQVVNTGEHAGSVGGLRGGFFEAHDRNYDPGKNPLVNWERTEYTGKHWIECFILKNGLLLARSGPFYVNVENASHAWRPWRRK